MRPSARGSAGRDERLFLLPGSHLFPLRFLRELRGVPMFMAEDVGLCTSVRHHQQKIVLFLSAMRSHRDRLRRAGFQVIYHEIGDSDELTYTDRLDRELTRRGFRALVSFEIEDRSFDSKIDQLCIRRGIQRCVLPSPMFMTRPDELRSKLGGGRTPRMADFYRWQRGRTGILVNPQGKPTGGRWSFDQENRKKLPPGARIPPDPPVRRTRHDREVADLVSARFGDHPGDLSDFRWPTTRAGALRWLDHFVTHRLPLFGPYEDAISSRSEALFHSRLSPLMNCGLLTPQEVLRRALARQSAVPLQSFEGFVRQVIGWREFVRGVDLVHGERQAAANAWGHDRRLRPCWWTGSTGVPPLDDLIETAHRTGWAHHIQRLMVAGNIMTLCAVHPTEAWRWFMEMFVDSAEWVMGPNVFGMGICSDGGIFATKPYICGSNYLLKMSDYSRGEWCDALDGLYWNFVARHREGLARNPRMARVVHTLDRIDPARHDRISAAGRMLQDRLTLAPHPASVAQDRENGETGRARARRRP